MSAIPDASEFQHSPTPWAFVEGKKRNLVSGPLCGINDAEGNLIALLGECSRFKAADIAAMSCAGELLEMLSQLIPALAEAHAGDPSADHYGDGECARCELIDQARALVEKAKEVKP